jgi:predicted transcriptional regulator
VSNYKEPSHQELHALATLWHEGPSTVSFVHESLHGHDGKSYTTTLAVMRNLEKKNLAVRNKNRRAHIYEAKVTRDLIIKPRLKDLVQNAFGGSLGQAILSLISVGVMTPEEKTAITRELKLHKAMAAKKKTKTKKAVKKAAKKTVKPAKTAAPKPAKKAAKKKVAKKAAAKKAAPEKAAKNAAPKKAAPKKAAPKKAAPKKAAPKKAAPKKAAPKKAAPKKAAPKKAAPKKAAKKKK